MEGICQLSLYSGSSVAQTLMAGLPRLFQIHS